MTLYYSLCISQIRNLNRSRSLSRGGLRKSLSAQSFGGKRKKKRRGSKAKKKKKKRSKGRKKSKGKKRGRRKSRY